MVRFPAQQLSLQELMIVIASRLTHYQTTNVKTSKLKEFADNSFKFDENGRKLSKSVENTVGKGDNAHDEQFLLFPVFSKGLFPSGLKKRHCVGIG